MHDCHEEYYDSTPLCLFPLFCTFFFLVVRTCDFTSTKRLPENEQLHKALLTGFD